MNQKYEELKHKYGRVGENKIMSYDIPNLSFLFELNSSSDDQYLLSVLEQFKDNLFKNKSLIELVEIKIDEGDQSISIKGLKTIYDKIYDSLQKYCENVAVEKEEVKLVLDKSSKSEFKRQFDKLATNCLNDQKIKIVFDQNQIIYTFLKEQE